MKQQRISAVSYLVCLLATLSTGSVVCGAEPASSVKTARDGAWSDPATWQGGCVPAAGDRVLIARGHHVTYDIESAAALRVVQVAGNLHFATYRNTRLDVGLLRIEDGDEPSEEGFDCTGHIAASPAGGPMPTLAVGTPNKPVEAKHTALIRLVYFEGMNKDSCPAIVNCGGRMEFHGAPLVNTWVKLGATAERGASEVSVLGSLAGWRVGDRVLIPTTERLFLIGRREVIPTVRTRSHSEERTIKNIAGDKIVLDSPLEHPHRGEGDYRGEVANLSRNVIVESADPKGVRGHTMNHVNSAGSISYAEFRHLGKRGVLGRYSLHYHLCRDTMRGSSVIGASIHDSQNRWLTIHGTDYLVVRDCVGYNSIGHGFFLEDGTETFNVLDHNLAVQALHGAPLPKQVLPYDQNEGAGFWWACSLNTFTRNTAAECDQYAYRFEATKTKDFEPVLDVPQPDGSTKPTDVRTISFVRFDDNEAHSQRRFSLNLGGIRHVSDQSDYEKVHTEGGDLSEIKGGHVLGVGPDSRHPFIIRNFKVWSSHWAFHGGSPCVMINGLDAFECTYGIFKTRMDQHEYRGLSMKKLDNPDIFQPWGKSDIEETYFRFLDPKDDLPPTTVITHIDRIDESQVRVRGTAADNDKIVSVTVNGQAATALRDNLAEWEVTLRAPLAEPLSLKAFAQDKAGNVEPRPHMVEVQKGSQVASLRGR